jgi:hypothetical protein
MQDNQSALMTYAKLAGLRVNVIANRLLCADGISRSMHDRLIEGLDDKIKIARTIAKLERHPVDPENPDDREFYFDSLNESMAEPIDLVDSLFIDRGTHEFKINGGTWQFGYDVESRQSEYPVKIHLDADELHGLHSIMEELAEIGVNATAYRVKEQWELATTRTPATSPGFF